MNAPSSAFAMFRSVENDLAYCGAVVSRLAETQGRVFTAIDPRHHSVTIPGQDKEGHYTKFFYRYEDNPLVVRSDAINLGIDALRVTLRAEALAREAVLTLDARPPDEERDALLKKAQYYADVLTGFHREAWDIREPASDDYSQRELHARLVAKRKIYGMIGRKNAETKNFY